MRKTWLFWWLLFGLFPAAEAQNAAMSGFCEQGGTQAQLSGTSSTNYQQGVVPSCTITVFLTGTMTKATLYSSSSGTPLSNPFTATAAGSSAPGQWTFWAATGQGYDVVASGGVSPNVYPSPVTLRTDAFTGGTGGGGGGVSSVSVVTANGFQGTVANPTTTPAITLNVDSTHYLPTTTDETNWNGKAPLDSPAFTGTPTAPTPSTSDSSTKIATTAYTRAYIASLTYLSPSGSITPGDCAQWATSTTLSDAGSPCGSGGGGAVSSVFGRTGAVVAANGDYTVSQVTGAAPLASPALTGTPTAPTPSTSDNSTEIATTAYTRAYVASLSYVTGSGTSGHCVQWGASNTLGDAGAACGSGSGGINQLTGDVTAGPGTGSQAATVVQIEGAAIPASSGYVGTNSSKQIVAPTATTPLNGVSTFEYGNAPKPPMTTLLQALHYAQTQPVNVVVIGDSFAVCDQNNCALGPTYNTNRWPDQLRIMLQAKYGSHGTGMVPIIVNQPEYINADAWTLAGTYDTSTSSLGPTQSTMTSLVHLHSGATATFSDNRGILWDTLVVYCMTNSSSGSIGVSIDGGAETGTACTSTSGSPTAHAVQISAGTLGLHTAVLTSTGDSYVYAAEGTAGSSGVSVHNLGIGGAESTAFGQSAATQLAFSDVIPTGTQGVIVMLQTNDAVDSLPTSSFSTYMQAIVSHEQALSTTPSVMLAIPPVSDVNSTTPLAPYTAVQLGLCSTLDVACANIQDRVTTVGGTTVGWGTTYRASYLWTGGTHPSDAGSIDEASIIYTQLGDAPTTQCAQNCTFYGQTDFQTNAPQSAFTVRNTLNTDYTNTQFTGTGRSWLAGVANAGETTFGAANKFFIFDANAGAMRWAVDTAGGVAIGYSTPFPTLFPELFCVGTSCQFGVDSSGEIVRTTAATTLTLKSTLATDYTMLGLIGQGVGANWSVGQGNGSETANGVAGKYFWFNGSMRGAIDATGDFAIGYATPYPTSFPKQFCVGSSCQFGVDSSGNATAASYTSTSTTAPLTLGVAGTYTGPLTVPAWCPGGGGFNLFTFTKGSGTPDSVKLGSCALLYIQSPVGEGGYIGSADHPGILSWDAANHLNVEDINSGSNGNTDLSGELTFSSGTATFTFTNYDSSAHPICVANDETGPNAIQITYAEVTSVWTATFHGTGTDTFNYICTGRSN